MALAEAEGAAAGGQRLKGDGVTVRAEPSLGGHSVAANRAFAAGELVFREEALVVAKGYTNLSRVRAYCDLTPESRESLRAQYWAEEPGVRCAATAACRPEAAGSGDSATDVLAALRGEGYSELTMSDVETVIRVWNLNAYDCALAPLACKVSHSCAPNVFLRVDADAGIVEAAASRPIAAGELLGTWYFQDTGLWWMGCDMRRAMFETDRGFACACTRCCEPDPCRALPCGACPSGAVLPESVATTRRPAWSCSACGQRSTGDAVRLAAEADLAPRVMLELRPPKNMARKNAEELVALEQEARARLGAGHWVSAAACLVVHFRARSPGGALDALAVARGFRFLGWLVSKSLAAPPAAVVRTPISVAMDCAAWLAPAPKALAGAAASPAGRAEGADRRCLAARLLAEFLLPIFDASSEAVAKVANTGARVQALREWRHGMRHTCGHASCGRPLSFQGAEATAAASQDGVAAVAPMACGRCKEVRYCSRACQTADWKERHKAGCLPATEALAGDPAWQLVLTAAATA